MTARAGAAHDHSEFAPVVRSGESAGHLKPLDGVRGIAIAAVLCFHTGASWAPGGFLGVDMFFVLSGFLITTLLLRERSRNGAISLGRFYARRALRLFPAVVAVCVFVLIHGPQLSGAEHTRGLRNGVLGTLFYFSNWQQAFDLLPLYNLTDHTWSLAIEEQFYLIWPPVLALLLWRRTGPRRLLGVLLTLTAVSVILRAALWLSGQPHARVYYGSDVRADALLIGCALAVVHYYGGLPRWVRLGAVPAAAALVAFIGLVHLQDGWLYDGGLTLIALTSAVFIAALVAAPGDVPARVVSWMPLRGLGRISYGLYLWHWPIFLILSPGVVGLSWLGTNAVRVAVSVAAAIASYFLIERPFLRLRHRFDANRQPERSGGVRDTPARVSAG